MQHVRWSNQDDTYAAYILFYLVFTHENCHVDPITAGSAYLRQQRVRNSKPTIIMVGRSSTPLLELAGHRIFCEACRDGPMGNSTCQNSTTRTLRHMPAGLHLQLSYINKLPCNFVRAALSRAAAPPYAERMAGTYILFCSQSLQKAVQWLRLPY